MEVDGLFDRDGEAAHLATALAAAAGGRGRLVAIEGDAGIGKTRLLRHVRALAERHKVPVLTARCAELEREYPFGVVRQLLEPRVNDSAFVGAAAQARPVFAAADAEHPRAELPILHGLYWLTVDLETAVILVDDLHHADAVSLRYLAYLAVRLEDLPILVVVTLRSGADDGLVHDVLASTDTAVLHPGPLGVPAVGKVLERILNKPVEAPFAEACHALAAGNPLFVHAVAAAVAGAGIEPAAGHVAELSTLDTPMVQRRVDAVLRRLPADARTIAETVALLGPRAPVGVLAALAGIDLVTAADAVDELTRLGLLERDDDAAGFVHPLVATAVYESMTAGRRSLAHQRAAQLLAERGVEPERCAAHLLKVVPGLTGDALPLLRRAAEAALARGSPEAALAFLRRCLAEDLEPALRDALTDRAAAVAMQVDLLQAVHLLELMRDRPEAADGARGARLSARLGIAYGYLVEPERAVAALEDALARLPGGDTDERRRLEAILLVAPIVVPGRQDIAGRVAELRRRPPADGIGARMLEAAIGCHEMIAGDPRGVDRARAALADGSLVRVANGEGPVVCGWLTLLAADDPAALRSLEDAVRQAHEGGSIRALAPAYAFRALGRLWQGQLRDAEADAREALRLSGGGRVDMDDAFAGAYLAGALVEQGRLEEASAVLGRLGPLAGRPAYYALDVRARLARTVEAADAAGAVWKAYGIDNPGLSSWRNDRALALFAAGDVAAAIETSRADLGIAERWGLARAHGRSLRTLGLVASDLGALRQSVEVLEGSPARLELAYSLAALGASLRRAGQRREAREPLHRALDLAEVCGAAPLVQQVRTELRTAGFRPRRDRLTGVDALTPSERRVAELAADGASNRDVAQHLFITTKTVEVHLTSAYRKLGVNRRIELAKALSSGS